MAIMITTTAEMLLAKCQLSIAYDPQGKQRLLWRAPSRDVARGLLDYSDRLACHAARFRVSHADVSFPGDGGQPYSIPAAMASGGNELSGEAMLPEHLDLLGADYRRILEFLLEQESEGNIVVITSNVTDICLHTNSLLLPSRGLRQPADWAGYGYSRSWRRSLEDFSQTNPEYDHLKTLLARDGEARDYEYTLFRPDVDGNPLLDAKVRYQTSYFLCQDYLGHPVRIGVSRPQDYEVLDLRTGVRLGR